MLELFITDATGQVHQPARKIIFLLFRCFLLLLSSSLLLAVPARHSGDDDDLLVLPQEDGVSQEQLPPVRNMGQFYYKVDLFIYRILVAMVVIGLISSDCLGRGVIGQGMKMSE